MYRMVHIVERNGRIREIPMTAQQAEFYHRLTELKAAIDPSITFYDVVLEQRNQPGRAQSRP
jgi:hypothetical protein